MNVKWWFPLFVLTFVAKTHSSSLLPGGTNVQTKYETYNTRVSTLQLKKKYRRTCTQTCTFWVFCSTKCSTTSYDVWVTVYKMVTKKRAIYQCKSGWKQKGNVCTIPICTGGCQNGGVCTAPDLCKCTPAWTGKNCDQDVNECNVNSGIRHGCQATCVNLPGSYKCRCPTGHYLASNGKNCTDHDECAGNIHSCQQGCVNYPGGYSCTCRPGYTLNANDSKTCDDVNECNITSASDGCQVTCVNLIGSYKCTCPNGYYLASNRKNCTDKDECGENIDGCQQGCVNYPGGYNCTCRPGYTLNAKDNETCDGHQCEKIHAPTNGKMQCTGNTTDHSCQFRCDPGYELLGSSNRSCSATGQWTGDGTMCKIIHCPKNPVPQYGFVYTPCDSAFGSKCIVGCLRGYFMEGATKITCNASGIWEPINLSCTKTTACERNPCKHGAICTPLSSSRYTCHCHPTGYRGINCDVGHFSTPKYPRITAGIPSLPLEFRSSPLSSGHVILTPSSRDVIFTPSSLVFNSTSSRQSLTVVSDKPGIHYVQYSISGSNAAEFVPPESDVIFVDPVTNSTNHTVQNATMNLELPVGCHDLQFQKCPSRDVVIIVSSTEGWESTGKVTSTSGVTVVRAGKTILPLSLLGTSLPSEAQPSNEKDCQVKRSYSIQQLIKYHVVTKSFLEALKDSFPRWLTLNLRRGIKANSFFLSDIKTQFLSAKLLRQSHDGKGQPISDDSSFLRLYSPNINLTIENDRDILKSRDERSRVSLAVDLCSASPMNVILGVSHRDLVLMQNSSVFKRLKQRGWQLTVYNLQISKTKSIKPLGEQRFSDGEKLIKSNLDMKEDLALLGRVKKSFAGENIRSFLEFDGTMVFAVDDLDSILNSPLDQSWLIDLYGNMRLTLQLTVEGSKTNVTFKAAESISFASFGGYTQESTSKQSNRQGLYISHVFERSPFINSRLAQYIEISPNVGIKAFLRMKLQSKPTSNESWYTLDQIKEVNMAFRGALKFGLLRFEDLGITVKVQDEVIHDKSTDLKFDGTTLRGKGKRNTTRKLGIFETDNLNVQIQISAQDSRDSVGSFESNVELFGFKDVVKVTFGRDGLSFNATGKVHGLYKADLSCFATLESWEGQKFVASGQFKAGSGSLLSSLRDAVYVYAYGVYDRARKRVRSYEEREKRAQERLQNILAFLEMKQQEFNKFQVEYNISKSKLEVAEMHLKRLESNVSQRLNKLKAHLNKLCPEVKQCPDICQAGVVCRQCKYEVTGKAKQTCNSTCFKTETRKIAMNSSSVLCKRQHCVRVYVKEGLAKDELKRKLTVLENDIFSFGRRSSSGNQNQGELSTFGKDEKATLFPGARKQDVCYYSEVLGNLVPKSSKHCKNDDRFGHWDCSIFTEPCSTPSFRYENYHEPYTCVRPCETHVSVEVIPKTCCETVPCAFKTVNRTCTAENHFCNKARKDALGKLVSNNSADIDLLKEVESYKQNVFYWQVQTQNAAIRLKSAKNLLHLTQRTANNLRKAYNNSIKSRQDISAVLAQELNLKLIFDQELTSLTGIKVESASFKIEVQKGGNYLLPVKFNLKINNTAKEFNGLLNLRTVNSSLGSIAKDILDLYGMTSDETDKGRRKRRSADNGQISDMTTSYAVSSLQKYHEMCSKFTNYEEVLYDVAISLFNLTSEAKELIQNSLKRNNSNAFNASEIFDNFEINSTEAKSFGLKIDKGSYLNNLENDRIMSAVRELQNEAYNDGVKPLYLNSKLLFRNWFAAMENLFNVLSPNCSGLEDCIVFITDGLSEMNDASGLPGAEKVRVMIGHLRSSLATLSQNADVTLDEANKASSNILRILKEMRNVKLFCASAPNITKQPEAFTEIGEGKSLLLTCKAKGDWLTYNWKFNGEYLTDQSTNTLLITNTTTANSGNYTCAVVNHISMETSTPALVVVHPAPRIIIQPIKRLNAVIYTNDSLRCIAEGTNNNVAHQWWFKAKNSSVFIRVMDEKYSYLNFIPVERHHEGWYYCNISNLYGSVRSTISYVKVLNFALSVPIATLSLTLTQSKTKSVRIVRRSEPNPIGHMDIQLKLAELLSLYANGNLTINNTSNSSMQPNTQVNNLHITQCNTITVPKVCEWLFQYVSKNTTGNSASVKNFEQNARKVIGSLRELNMAINRLRRAVNDGALSFNLGDQRFVVEKNSIGVEDVTRTCSRGKKLEKPFRCVDCPAGYYGEVDENMMTTCVLCRAGTYQTESGQAACTKCSEGFTTVKEGSIHKTDCKVICPAGKYGKVTENVGRCFDCPGNTYQPKRGQFACLPCPEGHVTATRGADDISKCYQEPATTRKTTTTEKTKTTEEVAITTEEAAITTKEAEITTKEVEVTPREEHVPSVGALSSSDNNGSAIGGAVGGFIFLSLLALVLLCLVRRRRFTRKSSGPLDDKTAVVPSELELNSWHNPGFEDEREYNGRENENPMYVSSMTSPVIENPIYETSPKNGDISGQKGIERDQDDFSDAAVLKVHGSCGNGGVKSEYGNPLYESNPTQDLGYAKLSRDDSSHYRESVSPLLKSNENGDVPNFGNPLYEALEIERARKGAPLKLTDDVIVDEDV